MPPSSEPALALASTVIVCDWIPPAFGAVGQYMERRAREAAARGEAVTLIGLGSVASSGTEWIGAGALTTIRLDTVAANKRGSLVGRAWWAMRTDARLVAAARRAIRGRSAGSARIVVTGSPPFLSYLLLLLNWAFWRQKVTYRITDFYPETVIAAGHLRWLRLAEPLFRWLRRRADRIEALGEDQVRRLVEGGIGRSTIDLRRDASPIDDWSAPPAARPFPDDKITLLYSGNLGVAHEIDTILAAYERHIRTGSDRVRIWLNATGARVEVFRDFCAARGLPLHSTPPVPLAELPGVLKAADAHLILLGRPFWGYVLPSKVYACLALQRPIVFVGPAESDVHLLGSPRPAYFHVEPGDVAGCLAALDRLADAVGRGAADVAAARPSL